MLDDLGLKANAKFVGVPGPDNLNETLDHAQDTRLFVRHRHVRPGRMEDQRRYQAKCRDGSVRALNCWHPTGYSCCTTITTGSLTLLTANYRMKRSSASRPRWPSLMDIYYVRNFGKVDAPPIVKKWARRIPVMHIKDGPLVQGPNQAAVGAGKMDVVSCLKAANPDVLQWAVVDLESCDGDMMAALAQSYRYLTGTGLVAGNR